MVSLQFSLPIDRVSWPPVSPTTSPGGNAPSDEDPDWRSTDRTPPDRQLPRVECRVGGNDLKQRVAHSRQDLTGVFVR